VSTFLRLLHPIMPFITEECWHALPGDRGSIVVAPWPKADASLLDAEAEAHMTLLMDAVRGIRNMRAEIGLASREEMEVLTVFEDATSRRVFEDNQDALKRLAQAAPVRIMERLAEKPAAALSTRCGGGEIFLPVPSTIDLSKEVDRLTKELGEVTEQIGRNAGQARQTGLCRESAPRGGGERARPPDRAGNRARPGIAAPRHDARSGSRQALTNRSNARWGNRFESGETNCARIAML